MSTSKPREGSGISKKSLKKMAKKGGIVKTIDTLYPDMNYSVRLYLVKVLKDSVLVTEYSRREVIEVKDVSAALTKHSKLVYGIK